MADFAYKVDNDVVFLDADTIEVLAHGEGQVVLVLSTSLLLPHHCGRVQANAGFF